MNKAIAIGDNLHAWFMPNAMNLLRISIGIIYVWFGLLKYFPNLSLADQLAKDTICLTTFCLIPNTEFIILQATWETILGFLLIANIWQRVVFYALLLHLLDTFIPCSSLQIFLLPTHHLCLH